jgi:hypothetical protein
MSGASLQSRFQEVRHDKVSCPARVVCDSSALEPSPGGKPDLPLCTMASFNEESRSVYAPDTMIVVEMSSFDFDFCFSTIGGGDCLVDGTGTSGIPAGKQLISSDETVASVVGEGELASIRLHRPVSTVLQLRETGGRPRKEPLASYRLIVSPVDAGTVCDNPSFDEGAYITDCSGQCAPINPLSSDVEPCPLRSPCRPISERISDGTCNFGILLDNGSRDIDLACKTFAFDGGDCIKGFLPELKDENPFLVIEDCSGYIVTGQDSIGPFERIRQALNDDVCNDESQAINLNCSVFAFDKGNLDCKPPP